MVLVEFISGWALGSDPVAIATGSPPHHHPQQPQVAVDAKGGIHVVYGVGNAVRYCRSTDGGRSFSEPLDLPSAPTIALGMRRGPRIAVTKAAICVSMIGGEQGKGRDGDLLVVRSTDGGKHWADPAAINDVAGSAREGLHAMAAGPGGQLACAWLDLRNRNTEVMGATSSDGGKTWGKNVLVYNSPQGSVCECCHPSMAFDPRGNLFVQWRNSLDGARDMYVAQSSDGGKAFGKAARLGTSSWTLNACPMDGGAIATFPNGKLATVWRRDKNVLLAVLNEKQEKQLGPGEQPSVAATVDGLYIVWLTKRGAAVQLLMPGRDSPIELAPHANDPVVAAGPGGRGPVVAAWESGHGEHHKILCQVIHP
jgi:hypothetical protein